MDDESGDNDAAVWATWWRGHSGLHTTNILAAKLSPAADCEWHNHRRDICVRNGAIKSPINGRTTPTDQPSLIAESMMLNIWSHFAVRLPIGQRPYWHSFLCRLETPVRSFVISLAPIRTPIGQCRWIRTPESIVPGITTALSCSSQPAQRILKYNPNGKWWTITAPWKTAPIGYSLIITPKVGGGIAVAKVTDLLVSQW